ncbi:hypothetical protein RRG08_016838 [Elysia crispata]|uniref:Uncharacterized protein n=1 Tax=Elysia crispata TaxID=231223 RepID=A0AAE0Z9I3_9GAST|nr:hypothetical protein RRG08_016838 [Elysia crispata]
MQLSTAVYTAGLYLAALLTLAQVSAESRGRSKLVRRRRDMSYEDMVVNEVLESYKKRTTHARPVRNFNDTLTVLFAIQLTQIMGLDEQEQIITLNFWDQLVSTLFLHCLFMRSAAGEYILALSQLLEPVGEYIILVFSQLLEPVVGEYIFLHSLNFWDQLILRYLLAWREVIVYRRSHLAQLAQSRVLSGMETDSTFCLSLQAANAFNLIAHWFALVSSQLTLNLPSAYPQLTLNLPSTYPQLILTLIFLICPQLLGCDHPPLPVSPERKLQPHESYWSEQPPY